MKIKSKLTSQDILGELYAMGIDDNTCMAIMYYARNFGPYSCPFYVVAFNDEDSLYEICIIDVRA